MRLSSYCYVEGNHENKVRLWCPFLYTEATIQESLSPCLSVSAVNSFHSHTINANAHLLVVVLRSDRSGRRHRRVEPNRT
jgi:hypothetical protein